MAVVSKPPSRFLGCTRGVFNLENWQPVRRPADSAFQVQGGGGVLPDYGGGKQVSPPSNPIVNQVPTSAMNGNPSSMQHVERFAAMPQQPMNRGSGDVAGAGQRNPYPVRAPPPPDTVEEKPIRLMVKYSFKANPDSPLGVELNVKQGDFVTKICANAEQPLWWLVENAAGQQGYVPAEYVMVIEEKVTSLPWLQQKPVESTPVSTEPYKPYKSAYVKENGTEAAAPGGPAANKWYCEVCAKAFNGPQPYTAHMASRTHKDEVAAQAP